MADNILKSKAPALALTPTDFSQAHFDILNSQLRLYFNTLDTANGQTIQQVNSLNVMNWLNTGSF